MNKFWLATASLLYPAISQDRLVSLNQIRRNYQVMFGEPLTASLEQQLISWKRRYADIKNPARGGSRNRYFFRTGDGHTPSASGDFRLYKCADSEFDGEEKSGPTCPGRDDVLVEFRYLIDWYLSVYQWTADDIDNHEVDEAVEKEILESDLPPTEKESLVNARRGQGVFKNRVAVVEPRCRLTGVSDTRFLIASHIKPWSISTNAERLDGNNGLLLSPHVDRLFDKGFITFDQNGRVRVAPEAEGVFSQWNLLLTQGRTLTAEQEEYMCYHRENIFRRIIQGTNL